MITVIFIPKMVNDDPVQQVREAMALKSQPIQNYEEIHTGLVRLLRSNNPHVQKIIRDILSDLKSEKERSDKEIAAQIRDSNR